jgi:hypothetical protein
MLINPIFLGVGILLAIVTCSLFLVTMVEAVQIHDPIVIDGDGDFNLSNGVTSGNGTEEDPYLISGWDITCSTNNCILIQDTTKRFVISDCTLDSPNSTYLYSGVKLLNVSGGIIGNISIIDPRNGIRLYDSDNVTIHNISMTPSGTFIIETCIDIEVRDVHLTTTRGLIWVERSSKVRLYRCRTVYNGFMVYRCSQVTAIECTSSGGLYGYSIDNSDRCIVLNCTFMNNSEYNMRIRGSNNTMRDTKLGERGLYYGGGYNNIDNSNTVNGMALAFYQNQSDVILDKAVGQICLVNCSNFTVRDLTFDGPYIPIQIYWLSASSFDNITLTPKNVGIYSRDLDSCSFSNISVDTINSWSNPRWGFYFSRPINSSISNSWINRTTDSGILIDNGQFTTSGWIVIQNVTIKNQFHLCIDIENGSNITIKDCNLSSSREGIEIDKCWSISVINSSISMISGGRGIYIIEAEKTLCIGNVLDNCSIGIRILRSDGAVLISNHFISIRNSGINIGNTRDVGIANSTFDRMSTGVYSFFSTASLTNLTMRRCDVGVKTWSDTTITDCVFIKCYQKGIDAMRVMNVSVLRCNITSSDEGVVVYESRNVTVSSCEIASCDLGILEEHSFNCVYTYNNITGCRSYAYEDSLGYGSIFHHNNLVLNNYNIGSSQYKGPQAFSDAGTSFDDGVEGNYWSDYQIRYPNATLIGRVWQTPYEIFNITDVYDYHPLVARVDLVAPVAIAGDDVRVDQNTTVILNGSGSWDNLVIIRFEWTFIYDGDPVNLTNKLSSFKFDLPGTYDVELNVSDEWGNWDTDMLVVEVIDTQPPIAIAGDDITVDMGDEFVLNATSSWDNTAIVYYNWTVDPGGMDLTFSGMVVRLTIDDPGQFLAVLNVTDSLGHSAQDVIMITVLDAISPIAHAGQDIEVDQGTEVLFDGSMSTDNIGIANWTWTFRYEDGNITLEGSMVTFVFTIPGEYLVMLEVTDGRGLKGGDGLIVTVIDTQSPVIITSGDIEVDEGTIVIINASGTWDNTMIANISWSFEYEGVPIYMSGIEMVFTFDIPGLYPVTIEVTDQTGNLASGIVNVTVKDITPPVPIIDIPSEVDQGQEVIIEGGRSHDNVGITRFTWIVQDYDGTTDIDGATVTYVFDVVGVYDVTLKIEDGEGNQASNTNQVTVLDIEPPVAIIGDDISIVGERSVTLDGSGSTDNVGIVEFKWSIVSDNDQIERVGETIVFHFEEPGSYIVLLNVHDLAQNEGSASINIEVLSVNASWDLGPFKNSKGEPIDSVYVSVTMNGTVYEGTTGLDGMVALRVTRFDILTEAHVRAEKKGWKPLDLTIALSEEGTPREELPPMERVDSSEEDSFLWIIAVVAAIALVSGFSWFIWSRRG